MVKKIVLFAAILLAACVKYTPQEESSKPAVRFVLQTGVKKPLALTRTSIASDAENEIRTLQVLAFDAQTGENEKIVYSGLDQIQIDETWLTAHRGQQMRFYFIANANVDGDPTETYLLECETAESRRLATPLLMTSQAVELKIPFAGKIEKTVALRRRTARFDVVNAYRKDFEITGVIIKQATIQGYFFAENSGTKTLAKEDLARIVPTGYTAEGMAAGAFYLYPTRLGEDATQIIVVGRYPGGVESIYPVRSTVAVEANKRYRLVLDATLMPVGKPEMLARIEVADYDDQGDHPYAPISSLQPSPFVLTGGAVWNDDAQSVDLSLDGAKNTVALNFLASSEQGVRVSLKDIEGDAAARGRIRVKEGYPKTTDVLTRAAGYNTELLLESTGHTGQNGQIEVQVFVEDAIQDVSYAFNIRGAEGRERWARSNIVWDATAKKLTFATSAAENATYPASVQGVFFKWGSLVAVAPTGKAYNTRSKILFAPTGNRNYEWRKIPTLTGAAAPYNNNDPNEDDFGADKGFNEASDVGDICRYISARGWVEGQWRLPTANEQKSLVAAGNVEWADNKWQNTASVVAPEVSDYTGGQYLPSAGHFFGAGATAGDNRTTPMRQVVSMPVSGYRNPGTGEAGYMAYQGQLWSGSSSDATTGFALGVGVAGVGTTSVQKPTGLPIRCIRILE